MNHKVNTKAIRRLSGNGIYSLSVTLNHQNDKEAVTSTDSPRPTHSKPGIPRKHAGLSKSLVHVVEEIKENSTFQE
jgi:hypothetical protein